MSEDWAFTVKYHFRGTTDDIARANYKILIDHWRSIKGVIVDKVVYEDQDKHGQRTLLHMHGKISISRGLYRKKLMMNGFHIKLVPYRDSGWEDYMNKLTLKGDKKLFKVHLDQSKGEKNSLANSSSPVPTSPVSPRLVVPKRSLFTDNI